MKKLSVIVCMVLFGTVLASADNSKLSNRTKLLVKESRESLKTNKAQKKFLAISAVKENNTITAFVTVNNNYQPGVIENYGGVVRNYYQSIGVLTAELPVETLEALSSEECIVSIEVSQPVKTNMDKARVASCAELLIGGVEPFTHSYMADGVLLGIVDQEIQLNHINFYNRFDKSVLRIKRFLNQSTGNEYKTQSAIEGAKYDTRSMSSGHATHVLGIAAGADISTNYYGIAQFADLAVVSTTGEDADLSDGVKYIFDYADEVDKPCVINISMGGLLGPHDGTETCNRVIESLVGPGRLVVGAAGNSGDIDMHVGKTLNGNDSLKTFLDLTYGWYYNYTITDIWGDENQNFEVAFVVYNDNGDSIMLSTPFINAMNDTTATLHLTKSGSYYSSVDVTIELAAGRNQYNNKGNVYFEYEEDDMPSNCYFGIIVRGDSGTVNMWTYDQLSEFTNHSLGRKGWSDGDSEMTIGTGVGDTRNVITVGSYATSSSYGSYGVGDISDFSSKGPLTTGQMKPEITAPGEVIVASYPELMDDYASFSTTVNGKKYYYGEMQGTSMSSPYCAGVIACWLEADNNLTYDDVVDVFKHTSRSDSYTGSVPNNTWGYGKLNAYTGLIRILGLDTDVANVSDEQKVIGYFSDDVAHVAGIDGEADIRIIDMSGKTLYSNNFENLSKGDEVEIDMSSMPDGIYVINVNGENFKIIK